MPTFSPTLDGAQGDDPTKVDWANTVQLLLGNTRRLQGFRNGVKFLDVGSSGPLTVVAGNIVGLGVLRGFTTRNAANLASGECKLRLSGNTDWVEFTLGLPGSNKEFTLPRNPTADQDTTYAFTADAGIRAPILLDSGTGPLSPTLTDDAPYEVELVAHEVGPTRTTVSMGSLLLTDRLENWVFDDPEIAANMGDVRVYRGDKSLRMNDLDFGAIMFAQTNQANSQVGDEPVYEVLCCWTPTPENWPDYPAYSGYKMNETNTFPTAYKVLIKTKTGKVLKVHEMRDGLPANSDQLNQDNGRIRFAPVRPHADCGQVLGWRSVKQKMNSYAQKYLPGFEGDFLRPTVGRQRFSTNMPQPILTGRFNTDGLGNWYTMPKWAFAGNDASVNQDTVSDPHMQGLYTDGQNWPDFQNGGLGNGFSRSIGWGHEIGSRGSMETLFGPGGSRNERGAFPHAYAVKFANPTYVRPRNNDPIDDMIDAWNMNYLNLSIHYIRNAQTWESLPLDELYNGKWSHGARTWYASNDVYATGGKAKTVPLFSMVNGDDSNFRDKSGRMPWSGTSIDYLHNYNTPGHGAIYFNSPMLAYLTRHRTITHFLCLISNDNGSQDPRDTFMRRHQAWCMMHLGLAWKLRSDHPICGLPGKLTEARIQRELEAVHDYAYKPAMVDNSQDPYHVSLRNIGLSLKWESDFWTTAAYGQIFYLGLVWQQWKQFGLFSRARKMSYKCDKALIFTIRCLDLNGVDFILDTNGAEETPGVIYEDNRSYTNPKIVASWADLAAKWPKPAKQDWIHNGDGSIVNNRERDITQHMRAQWVNIHLNYFPEIPCERGQAGLEAACAKYKGFYKEIADRVQARVSRDEDWTYFWGPYAIVKPPIELGPE